MAEPVNIAEPPTVDLLEAIRSDVADAEPEAPLALEPVAEPLNIVEPPTVDLLEVIRSDVADPEPEAPPAVEPVAQPVNTSLARPAGGYPIRGNERTRVSRRVLRIQKSFPIVESPSIAALAGSGCPPGGDLDRAPYRSEGAGSGCAGGNENGFCSCCAGHYRRSCGCCSTGAASARCTSAVKGTHHARITMLSGSWISIAADGKFYQRTLQAGDIHEFEFSEKAILRLGNAPGVQITFDDTQLAPLRSSVRTVLGPRSGLNPRRATNLKPIAPRPHSEATRCCLTML